MAASEARRPTAAGVRLAIASSGALLLLSVWEAASRSGAVDERYLPPASGVLRQLVASLGDPAFWADAGRTMTNWAVGLAIAVVAGCVLGLLIGSSDFLRRFTHSTIEFLRPIPSVALIPLAVLLFGTHMGSALMLIVYASFWQVLLQVLYGVADVDTVADDAARSYGLGRWARLRHVVWPTVLPYLMTGIRLAAAVALTLAITAELVIGTPGLGKQIALAEAGGAAAEMYALIVAAGLIGVVINIGMRALERRLLGWHTSVRTESPA